MAEAVLSTVMDQLGSIARVQVEQEVKLVVGVDEDLEHITKSLTMIRAVLADAETKQVANEAVKLWLQDLKRIMYDAEDVLDEWFTRIAISQSNCSGVITNGVREKVHSCLSSLCSCFQPIIVHHVIGRRILDVRERLDKNSQSVSQLKLIENLRKEDHHQRRNITSPIFNVSEIKGRDTEKRDIVEKLFSETSNSTQSIVVVSIVGTGGLGKTTLAQLIYNEPFKVHINGGHMVNNFVLKMWVCVSETFNLERLAMEIIKQATRCKPDVIGWEALRKLLFRAVEGRRFLLVLDDVWSEDENDWALLKNSLSSGEQESRIVVTTRSKKVAKIMGSIYTHELKQLPDEDCWLLFRRIAFKGRLQDEVESLEKIGREVANKCKGNPLAAETLASHMQFADSKDDWRDVLKSDLWDVTIEDAKGFFPALLLSYQALSPQLKQCFMYTAIFPDDAIIKRDMLVKLWMAQGYLGLDGTTELEIIGRRVFDDLSMRLFFRKHKTDPWDDRDIWKMHGLVREFAQFLTKTEFSLEKDGFSSNKVCHIHANSGICEGSKVRTLLPSSFLISKPKLSELFQRLKCLRALGLSNAGIKKVPDEVGTLSHLRYLDLSGNWQFLEKLPETVCNLYNLQTLILNGCEYLRKLPHGLGRLSNLRHLEIESTDYLECIPKSIGKLSSLRTLSRFIVSEECTIEELGRLNHLTGELVISGLHLVANEKEARRAQLLEKENLRSLELCEIGESVLEGLQPNKNLERLGIWSYTGSTFPRWIVMCDSSLPNIVDLELYTCRNCRQLPSALGKLKHLHTLRIRDLPLVKDLSFGGNGASSSSEMILFPKLRTLDLDDMKEWDEGIQESISSTSIMPCLEFLNINNCPKLKVVPHHMLSSSSENLHISIWNCPQVESLILLGNASLNVSDSLKYVCISKSPTVSFQLRADDLKYLKMEDCEYINLDPYLYWQQFPMLQELKIYNCPKVENSCRTEDWGSTHSDIPYKIIINDKEITKGRLNYIQN